MIVFADDVYAAMNEWGEQVTNEIVPQLLEQGACTRWRSPSGT